LVTQLFTLPVQPLFPLPTREFVQCQSAAIHYYRNTIFSCFFPPQACLFPIDTAFPALGPSGLASASRITRCSRFPCLSLILFYNPLALFGGCQHASPTLFVFSLSCIPCLSNFYFSNPFLLYIARPAGLRDISSRCACSTFFSRSLPSCEPCNGDTVVPTQVVLYRSQDVPLLFSPSCRPPHVDLVADPFRSRHANFRDFGAPLILPPSGCAIPQFAILDRRLFHFLLCNVPFSPLIPFLRFQNEDGF